MTRVPSVLGSENSGASMPTVRFSPGQSGDPGFGLRRDGGGIGEGEPDPAPAMAASFDAACFDAALDVAGFVEGAADFEAAAGRGSVRPFAFSKGLAADAFFLVPPALGGAFFALGRAVGFLLAVAFPLTAFLAFFATGRFLALAGATCSPIYACIE